MREGSHSRRISRAIEIWKGRYKDKTVALKVFKVSRQDPHILAFTSVSMPCDPQGGELFVVGLTDVIAALPGTSVHETTQT